MKKHILLINNENISVRNHRILFVKYLISKGFKVSVASAVIDDDVDTIKNICDFYELKQLNLHSTNPINDVKFLMELILLYKKITPDNILHFTAKPNIYGTIAASLLNIPSFATVNGLGRVFEENDFTNKIVTQLYRISFRKSKRIFFQNNDDRDLFIEKKIVKLQNSEVVLGSGIDTKQIKINTNSDWLQNKKIFILASRLIWTKGVKEFILAAEIVKEKYPECQFRIYGFIAKHDKSAVTSEYLEEYHKKGVINYCGVSNEMINDLAKSDVVILPSYYREGVPKVLIEALALGKPIITTDNIGCRETVDNNINGYIIKKQNPNDLADAIFKILNLTENNFFKMGLESRKKAELEFDQEIIYSRYIENLCAIG